MGNYHAIKHPHVVHSMGTTNTVQTWPINGRKGLKSSSKSIQVETQVTDLPKEPTTKVIYLYIHLYLTSILLYANRLQSPYSLYNLDLSAKQLELLPKEITLYTQLANLTITQNRLANLAPDEELLLIQAAKRISPPLDL